MALALCLLLLGVVSVITYSPLFAAPTDERAIRLGSGDVQQYKLPAGDPKRLTVDSVDIDAPMGQVHLPPGGGTLVPPFDVAAWYAEGPRPGFPGPSVIVGHVDSTQGPNVFWNLHLVKKGDKITVWYPHQTVTFVVTKTQTAAQDRLPTKQIWNKTSTQVLRLITCIGTFDHATRNYSDNYIVYARETGIRIVR